MSGIAVLFMLLNRALAGCVNLDFLDSDQIVPNQAHIQAAQNEFCMIALSGIYIHSNADAGLHGPGQIMVGYLKHFLAVLSRSGSKQASMPLN